MVVVLQVRDGKLLGKEVFRIGEWGPEEESFSQFLTDHYAGVRTFPEEVLVDSPWTRRASPRTCAGWPAVPSPCACPSGAGTRR